MKKSKRKPEVVKKPKRKTEGYEILEEHGGSYIMLFVQYGPNALDHLSIAIDDFLQNLPDNREYEIQNFGYVTALNEAFTRLARV